MTRRLPVLAVALALVAGTALAGRPPRRCDVAHAWVGPPAVPTAQGLHDPILDAPLEGSLDAAIVQRLEAVLDDALSRTPIVGVQVAIGRPGTGRWSAVRGMATPGGRAVTADDRFHVASVGKLLTATLAWQLVEKGDLSLDDPLARWFPDAPNAQATRIAHLLSHTSGHGNFNANKRFHLSTEAMDAPPLLARAFREAPLYCPGATASYSNTGFLLLGEIVERVGGGSLSEQAKARVFAPLGLEDSAVLPWDTYDGPTVPGHRAGLLVGTQPWGRPHGAGPMVSSADDLVTLLHGLIGERIVTADTIQAMATPMRPLAGMPGLAAGQGLLQMDTGALAFVGHPGGITGFSAVVLVSPEHRAYVAVVANDEATNTTAMAWALLKALGHVESKGD